MIVTIEEAKTKMIYPNTDTKPTVPYENLLMYQDSLSLPEGRVVFSYPAKMSETSYKYLARFLQLALDIVKNSSDLEK